MPVVQVSDFMTEVLLVTKDARFLVVAVLSSGTERAEQIRAGIALAYADQLGMAVDAVYDHVELRGNSFLITVQPDHVYGIWQVAEIPYL